MSAPILIIGASGYLGGLLYHALSASHPVVGTCTKPVARLQALDIRCAEQVRAVLDQTWEFILHTAALVDVRACNQDPGLAHAINVAGTRYLTQAARCKIIYFSTDNVFNGNQRVYYEDDAPSPLSEYGRTKLEAEHIILQARPDNLVVRIPFLFGWSPYTDKFITRFARPTTLVADPIYFNPLYLPDIVLHLDELRQYAGIVHLGGSTETTRYEFYQLVRDGLQLPTQIVPVTPEVAFGGHHRPHAAILRSKRLAFRGRPAGEALQDLKHYYGDNFQ